MSHPCPFVFVRHGETDDNRDAIRLDPPDGGAPWRATKME